MNTTEKQSLIQNLEDAACSQEEIADVIRLLASDQNKDGIRKLKQHRCSLMNELHVQQQKVDCLDYLLQKLQGGN